MSNRIYLTSFYGIASEDDPHWPDRQKRLHQSALQRGGVDAVIPWNAEKLQETEFARNNHQILSLKRGYGFWLWKPFIILDGLRKIDSGDYLIYHDVGRPKRGDPTRGYTLDRDIRPLVDWADANSGIYPGVYMPHHGKQKHWTKRDCFILMGCDEEKYWEATQIQATYNVWKNTPEVRAFVKEWLNYCLNPAILTDQENTRGLENFPGFKEHRHDQSVLTNLCIQRNVKPYGSPTQPILLHRDLNSLIRHARFDELIANSENILRQKVSELPEQSFDKSTIRWIELYFAERRKTNLSILLIGSHNRDFWSDYAPLAAINVIDSGDLDSCSPAQLQDKTAERYDLIWVNASGQPDRQFDLTAALIPRLNRSGMLICGQVEKRWDSLPGNHRSALALMRDAWSNKKVEHGGLSESQRQQINANLLMAFVSWDKTGQTGNTYFVSYDS